MSNDKVQVNSGGVSFLGLLAIVFITLRLTNVISWSWWWVLAPLWIGIPVLAVFISLLVLIAIAIK